MRVLLGILILFSAIRADAEVICRQLFSEFTPSSNPARILTVQVKEAAVDENGNSVLIFERMGSLPWYSLHRESSQDLQGDPRFFAMVLGSKVAHNFGFRFISDSQMVAPTASTFNSYIRKMNLKLKLAKQEVIRTFFYEDTLNVESNLEYLRRFGHESRLPLAKSGNLAVHDISYHTLSILLQNNLLVPAQKTARFILELKSSLESDPRLSSTEVALAKKYMDELIEQVVSDIDVATGNIAAIKAKPERTDFLTNQRLFASSLSRLKNLPDLLNINTLMSDLTQFTSKLNQNSSKLHNAFVRNYSKVAQKFFSESPSATMNEKMMAYITKEDAWTKINPVEKNEQSEAELTAEIDARIILFKKLVEEDAN